MSELALKSPFLADIDELRPAYTAGEPIPIPGTTVTPVGSTSVNLPGAAAQNQESDISTVGQDMVAATPWYPDQILPFDIVLSATNEYGMLSIMKILGIELMNSGFGVSIDDIVCEHSYTYIATGIIPWTTQGIHPDMENVL